jgi:hypothetical protein
MTTIVGGGMREVSMTGISYHYWTLSWIFRQNGLEGYQQKVGMKKRAAVRDTTGSK